MVDGISDLIPTLSVPFALYQIQVMGFGLVSPILHKITTVSPT